MKGERWIVSGSGEEKVTVLFMGVKRESDEVKVILTREPRRRSAAVMRKLPVDRPSVERIGAFFRGVDACALISHPTSMLYMHSTQAVQHRLAKIDPRMKNSRALLFPIYLI